MKRISLPIACLLACSSLAQKPGDIKTFKDKKVKLNVDNLYRLEIEGDNEMKAYTFNKKGQAEVTSFDSSLGLKDRKDVDFDFDKDEQETFKKRYGSQVRMEYGDNGYPYLVLKDNVLYITSNVLGIKIQGDMNKIGLNVQATGMLLQKGQIIQYTSSYNHGTYGSGNSVETRFKALQEVRLKSDEEKNMDFEYQKSNGEVFSFANTSEMNMTTYNKSGTEKELLYSGQYADYYKVYDKYTAHSKQKTAYGMIRRSMIEGATGDMLIVGKRRPIVKFAKRPAPEDMLPYYYVFRIDPLTLEVKEQSKFQEPVSRGVIFRHCLNVSGGMLLVSAPTKFAGDNVMPKDENGRRYVFRHIAENTKPDWQVEYEMPSGFTRFVNAIELPDSSIILYGTADSKKADTYYNKKIGLSGDVFYSIKIRNGKVLGAFATPLDSYHASFRLPEGLKAKEGYDPETQTLTVVQTRYLSDGNTMLVATATEFDGKEQKDKIKGNVILVFNTEGKLERQFWIPSDSPVKPGLDPLTFQQSEHEFLWLTFESGDPNGRFMHPSFCRINLESNSVSAPVPVGDAKHFVTTKNPMIISPDNKVLNFFGFDKGGKEFWTQAITLE